MLVLSSHFAFVLTGIGYHYYSTRSPISVHIWIHAYELIGYSTSISFRIRALEERRLTKAGH